MYTLDVSAFEFLGFGWIPHFRDKSCDRKRRPDMKLNIKRIFDIFNFTKKNKHSKKRTEKKELEATPAPINEDDKIKAAEEMRSLCRATDDGYDKAFRACITAEDIEHFSNAYFGDKKFWGGTLALALYGGDYKRDVSDSAAVYGFNKGNPIVCFLKDFINKTQGEECRYPYKKLNYENFRAYIEIGKFLYKDDSEGYARHLSDAKNIELDVWGLPVFAFEAYMRERFGEFSSLFAFCYVNEVGECVTDFVCTDTESDARASFAKSHTENPQIVNVYRVLKSGD